MGQEINKRSFDKIDFDRFNQELLTETNLLKTSNYSYFQIDKNKNVRGSSLCPNRN